jgi:trehalose 2-sulfotransferase
MADNEFGGQQPKPMLGGYFICATPRTGSTLLCGLLASSGVAGRPESYFRAQDEQTWASRFKLGGSYSYGNFVRAARDHGTTENGVFGARLMWGTLEELVDRVRPTTSAGSDLDVLRAAFGELRFVHVWREDVLAQAVSWALAEKSNVWHATPGEQRDVVHEAPVFDRAMVSKLLTTIDKHNRAWRNWFANVDTQPYEVRYEDLDRDPLTTGAHVLQTLGLAERATRLEVRVERLRDDTNQAWISQYRDRQ